MTRWWTPIALSAAALGITSSQAAAQRDSASAVLARIRDEGLNRSQVLETALGLSDLNGPRLAGSAGYLRVTASPRGAWPTRRSSRGGGADPVGSLIASRSR